MNNNSVKKIKKLIATEAQEMIAFMDWTKTINVPIEPFPLKKSLWHCVFHIPNETKRTKFGHILQARMGKKRGASDLLVCFPAGRWHGLFIEMKRKSVRAKPTLYQKQFIATLKQFGYWGVIAYGADDAIDHTICYLKESFEAINYAYPACSNSQKPEITF